MTRIVWIQVGMSLVIACSSSSMSPDKPSAATYDDTAQAIATMTASNTASNARGANADSTASGGDTASMSETVALSLGSVPTGISLSGDGHYHGSHLGVDYSYVLTCKLQSGIAITCGPTTDLATADITWTGSLTIPAVSAVVSRQGSWTVAGLQSATATFSGTSTFTLDADIQSRFRTGARVQYSLAATATYDAVQTTTRDRTVIGGSIAYDIDAHDTVTPAGGSGAASAAFAIHADLAFHADQTASLTLDGDQHYTLDVATGVVARVYAN